MISYMDNSAVVMLILLIVIIISVLVLIAFKRGMFERPSKEENIYIDRRTKLIRNPHEYHVRNFQFNSTNYDS